MGKQQSVQGAQRGSIKRIVRDRGFGFITGQGGQEYFFHRSSMDKDAFDQAQERDAVEFDIEDSAKGPRAGSVRLIAQ